jgi:hypothetical protein
MRCILIIAAGAALTLATVVPAAADFKVQMPDAETGEFSIEPLGDYGHDPNPAHSGELSTTQEFEYGVNGFWRTELELEQERAAGPQQSYNFSQVTSENIFQFRARPILARRRIFCRVRQIHAAGQPRRIHLRADIPQGNLRHSQYRKPVYAKGGR